MDNKFVWWSERDGFDHLYLYTTDGMQVRQLTSGKWLVNEIAGMNATTRKLVITATKESPTEKHSYSFRYR
jgi:dipeptidyl-peptidase-4